MNDSEITRLEHLLKALQAELQSIKRRNFQRRVPFGDLITDRAENARLCGFGEGTTMYDNVLVLGDVKVGSHTWIGPGVVLDGSGELSIGDYVSISAGVHIYTHHTLNWAVSRGAEAPERAPTRIGSGIYIGPNSIVQMGVTIGDGAVIGAMSFVNRDVPPGARVYGCPARVAG
jgi:acetyltransferase-like isoleucine patch superfamily enzyme